MCIRIVFDELKSQYSCDSLKIRILTRNRYFHSDLHIGIQRFTQSYVVVVVVLIYSVISRLQRWLHHSSFTSVWIGYRTVRHRHKARGKTHFLSAVQLNCSDCSFIQNNKCAGDDMKSLLLFFLPLMGINPQRPMGDFFYGFWKLKAD